MSPWSAKLNNTIIVIHNQINKRYPNSKKKMKNKDHENEEETHTKNTYKHSSPTGSIGFRALYCLPKLNKESSSILSPSAFLPLLFGFFFFLSQSLPLYISSAYSTLPKKSFFFSISSTIHQSLLPNGLPPLPHQDSFIFQKKLQHLFPSQCGLLFPHSQNSSFPRIELN